MDQNFALVKLLLVLALVVCAIYWFGRWILGPIDRAAKARRAAIRFSVSDFLCLFVAVQLPLTVVSYLQSDETASLFWASTILAWVVAPIIWTSCAVFLSRAGITGGKHRFVFMGLVLPIVYYGLTPFILVAAFAIGMLLAGNLHQLMELWWLLPAWLLTGAALVGCGFYTNWLVEHTNCEETAAANDFGPPVDNDVFYAGPE